MFFTIKCRTPALVSVVETLLKLLLRQGFFLSFLLPEGPFILVLKKAIALNAILREIIASCFLVDERSVIASLYRLCRTDKKIAAK